MKVQVLTHDNGRIVSLSIPGDTGPAPSGIAKGGPVVEAGQQLHSVEIPPEFEAHPLVELTHLLRVEVHGSTARLVAAHDDPDGTRDAD